VPSQDRDDFVEDGFGLIGVKLIISHSASPFIISKGSPSTKALGILK
jgi:hypothetical protein